MTTFSIAAERDQRAADGANRIAVSERAKQQIASQALKSRAKLQGPAFFESFIAGPAQ